MFSRQTQLNVILNVKVSWWCFLLPTVWNINTWSSNAVPEQMPSLHRLVANGPCPEGPLEQDLLMRTRQLSPLLVALINLTLHLLKMGSGHCRAFWREVGPPGTTLTVPGENACCRLVPQLLAVTLITSLLAALQNRRNIQHKQGRCAALCCAKKEGAQDKIRSKTHFDVRSPGPTEV